jgi:hypothetical protein
MAVCAPHTQALPLKYVFDAESCEYQEKSPHILGQTSLVMGD